MTAASQLERGREAQERLEWGEAREALERADAESPLGAEDLWRLGVAAYLTGHVATFLDALERAHEAWLAAGEVPAAARAATWLGMHLGERGEVARASGWFGRAARLLDDAGAPAESPERGFLLVPAALQRAMSGDAAGAERLAAEAAGVAQRSGDRDVLALAVHMQGRAVLVQGRVVEGLALLDEAMVAVTSEELSPLVTGLVYCSVLGACRSVYAVGRAHEWTEALAEWCARQPDMVAYAGECGVYRSELMQMHGRWREALDEAKRAEERMHRARGPAAALALYQQGEAHRLLGELDAAEVAYRAASRAGREPQPGLALLRLAQGDDEAAAAAIRRALSESADPLRRARLLPAYVEVLLATAEGSGAGAGKAIEDADAGAAELEALAERYGSPVLVAMAAHARGAVLLARGDPSAALSHLRRAASEWRGLDAPYDAARARVLLGRACEALGDRDGAALELEAAVAVLERLGASPGTAGVEAGGGDRGDTGGGDRGGTGGGDRGGTGGRDRGGTGGGDRGGARAARGRRHGLTPRETEVLTEVATGRTNREVAERLFISEKTVARHVSNIFGKLGVSSRAAATAFAYEHGLAGAADEGDAGGGAPSSPA